MKFSPIHSLQFFTAYNLTFTPSQAIFTPGLPETGFLSFGSRTRTRTGEGGFPWKSVFMLHPSPLFFAHFP